MVVAVVAIAIALTVNKVILVNYYQESISLLHRSTCNVNDLKR